MNLDDSLRDKAAANGDFSDGAALAQAIKMLFRRGKNWDALPPESKEALELSASQIAALLNGDASVGEHWNQVAGWMRLRGKALEQGALESSVSSLARLRTRQSFGLSAPEEDGTA